jgi:PPOX class probable F420-dependent enzyme
MTTIPETHRDLLDAQVAVLGTVGASGRPQLSAIWFLAEGDTVKLSLNTSRQKLKNLQANPACSLLILDPANPYRYVELRGDAEIAADPDYEFAKKVGAKYGGADLSEHDGPGDVRMIVTLTPKRVTVWGGGGGGGGGPPRPPPAPPPPRGGPARE